MGKIKSARKNYYSDTYIGYLPAYWLQKAKAQRRQDHPCCQPSVDVLEHEVFEEVAGR